MRIFLFALALFAHGCATLDSVYGPERIRSLEGKRLDELERVTDAVYVDGRLFVAHGGQSTGIAIVDTGTQIVTHFITLDVDDIDLLLDSARQIVVLTKDYSGSNSPYLKIAWLNPETLAFTRYTGSLPSPYGDMSLQLIGMDYFFMDLANRRIFQTRFTPQTSTGFELKATLPNQPRIIAKTVDRSFIATHQNSDLFVYNTSWQITDTLKIHTGAEPDPWRVSSLIGTGDKLFATLINVNRSDTGSVVVLHPQSLATLTTIPLATGQVASSERLGGRLYISNQGYPPYYGFSGNRIGSVVVIDLETASSRGVLFSDSSLGLNLIRYVPVTERSGYGICWHPTTSGLVVIRKVTIPP